MRHANRCCLQKDKVNKDILMGIKATFEAAVKGKTGRLSQEDFAAAFEGLSLGIDVCGTCSAEFCDFVGAPCFFIAFVVIDTL